ncbi:MAG: type II secretion system minor pseudopilin GspK [Betaproteobacteria bacterium]
MRRRQLGVAIVLAMGIVALAAMTATAIMVSQSTWARQSELTADHVQAQRLVRAGVDWARAVLNDDRRRGNVDHLGEPWALRAAPMPVINGEIAGYIEDQQGAFNLNNLAIGGTIDRVELVRFRRLLAILDLPAKLADALADWLDADSERLSADGAEDDYYLARQPPYLAANQLLADISELALVRGFDDKVRARLRPYVTALPHATQVNVNTAPAEVLAVAIDGLNLDAARALVAQRDRVYFSSVADFANRLPGGLVIPASGIALSSQYFVVTLHAAIGQAQAHGRVLLTREGSGWPAIVWQKIL